MHNISANSIAEIIQRDHRRMCASLGVLQYLRPGWQSAVERSPYMPIVSSTEREFTSRYSAAIKRIAERVARGGVKGIAVEVHKTIAGCYAQWILVLEP